MRNLHFHSLEISELIRTYPDRFENDNCFLNYFIVFIFSES